MAAYYKKGDSKSILSSLLGPFERFFGVKKKDDQEYMGWDSKDVPKKIMESVKRAYKRMEPLRQSCKEAEKQFIGQVKGLEEGAKKPIPINKIYQMVRIYMRLLAPTNPQVIVSTEYKELKPFADRMRLAINRQMKELKINEIIYRSVLDAMFGYGVVKTGVAVGEQEFKLDGESAEIGMPYSANITMNNFVIDMEAENFDDVAFIGDRFRMPETYFKKFMKDEKADNKPSNDMDPEKRATGVDYDDEDSIYAQAWYWEIYLPKQNLIMLFLDGKKDPLIVHKWEGPEQGPYQILGFDWAPSEVMPVPPTRSLMPLHNFINNLLRKLERQAISQKTLTVTDAGNPDADVINKASDGDSVGLVTPGSVQEVSYGGPNPMNHNMSIWSIQEFDEHAGGLQGLAGTSPMSETYGQDKLLNDSANALIDAMRQTVTNFINKIIYAHAWYLWTEPIRSFEVVQYVEGTEYREPVTITPEEREGDFLQYNFKIDPFSMQNESPQEKAQKIINLFMNIVMPSAQMAQQAGYIPNVKGILRQVCELQGIPFNDMYIPVDLTMQSEPSGQTPAPPRLGGQAFKQTVNTRVSRPGATREGNMNKIVNANSALMGQAS